ncbi:MAG: hypothetical protein R3E56_04815 [Burkholderiaceae bacterium]
MSAPTVDHKHAPGAAITDQRSTGGKQGAVVRLRDDVCINAIAVAQPLQHRRPTLHRHNDVDALFFNAQRGW